MIIRIWPDGHWIEECEPLPTHMSDDFETKEVLDPIHEYDGLLDLAVDTYVHKRQFSQQELLDMDYSFYIALCLQVLCFQDKECWDTKHPEQYDSYWGSHRLRLTQIDKAIEGIYRHMED